jgi:TRAP transporter TAXI family solute receptor
MTQLDSVNKERRLLRLSRTTAIAVIAIVLLVSLVIFKPAAPKKIILLTGPEGTGYHALGQRYAEYLEQQGLQTELRATLGGFDNVQQLAAGAEDTVAFAPSNIEHVIGDSEDTSHLVTLGSIAYEPLWLFFRSDLEVRRIPDLAGLRVATGADGTVVNYVARHLLEMNRVTDQVDTLPSEGQTPEAVADALAEGRIDAGFGIGGPASPLINRMLTDDRVSLLSFERADAYQALDPGIAKLVAPEGIFDLARNIPSEDLALLAATTNLVALDNLYPSVVPLMLEAASAIQSEQRIVTAGESFPSADHVSLPLHRGAKRFYDQGETGLSKYLPYKVTRWLNHLGIVVLPLLTLAFVLVKIAPMVLKIWGNIQLVGLLKRLEAVEKADAAGGDREQLLADLDLIDQKSAKLFVPRSTVHDYIDFRQFLHDMRERVGGP